MNYRKPGTKAVAIENDVIRQSVGRKQPGADAGDRPRAHLCRNDRGAGIELRRQAAANAAAAIVVAVPAYAVTVPPLLRRPIYWSSANTPVAIACATTMTMPKAFGETLPENSSAMLPSVQAVLPTITSRTSAFIMVCRVPSQPTKAA